MKDKIDLIITIDQFEGPLDLLIHLIKESKLDLFQLDILLLANQYINYIQAMESLNLEIASEYLVLLAELIEYKSKKLLPKESANLDDDYEGINPDLLVARIIEYKKYKEVSQQLSELSLQREKMMTKPQSSMVDKCVLQSDSVIEPMAIYQLINAMEKMQKRIAILEPLRLKKALREMTVDERIIQIQYLIKELPSIFSFEDLCGDIQSRMMLILTFLAILELLKKQFLIYQLKNDTLYFQKGVNYG